MSEERTNGVDSSDWLGHWQQTSMDCDNCGYEWQAVHPVTCEYLQCPVCQWMTPAPYVEDSLCNTANTKTDQSQDTSAGLKTKRLARLLFGLKKMARSLLTTISVKKLVKKGPIPHSPNTEVRHEERVASTD